MLRIVQVADAAAAKAYYQASDYYLGAGQELPGVWGGQGAAMLGLDGRVEKEQFDRLCDNLHPDTGNQLTAHHKGNRRVGWDFNWHCPKSVTLAYELRGDDRVLAAFREAVAYAMGEAEKDAQARVRLDGADEDRVVGNLTYATFVHRTARPVGGVPDPHLHAHCVVFNAVHDPAEGKWKAAQVADLKRHAGYYEALMLNRLAGSMVGLGYGVRRKGRAFELAGVSDELVKAFSRRTSLIETLADKLGLDGAAKDALGKRTREKKADHLSPAELRTLWAGRLTPEQTHQLENLPGQEAPLPDDRRAMGFALSHAFERAAVVAEKAVVEAALRFGVGGVTPDGLRAAGRAGGLLVKGDRSTTRDVLRAEAAVLDFARDGKGACRPVAPGRAVPEGLSAGQRDAVRHLWDTPDRLALVRGAAGTGKTTMLKAAVDGMAAAGLEVRPVAVSADAAEVLGKELGRPAATLARLLIDQRMQGEVRGGLVLVDEALLVGTRQMAELVGVLGRVGARAVLVGDPAQHNAVEAGGPFAAVQKFAGLPCPELTDIRRQRGAYREAASRLARGETGGALDLLAQMGWVREAGHTERMKGIVADYLWAAGEGKSVLVVSPSHAEGDSVTRHLRAALKERGKLGSEERVVHRLVPAHLTGAERAELGPGSDADAEAALVARFHRNTGPHKAGDRVAVAAADPAALTRAANYTVYREDTLALAPGDAVRVTAPGKDVTGKHKLSTGATYALAGFTPAGDLKLSNGWVLAQDFGHLAHGYVSTSHASQGRTVDVVILAASAASVPATGADTAYVALTRARHHAFLWTDDLAGFRAAAGRDRKQANAHDLVGVQPDPNRPARPSARTLFARRLAAAARAAADRVRDFIRPTPELSYER